MPQILHINTALDTAFVSLSKQQEVITEVQNTQRGDHASWIHPAIENILATNQLRVSQLDAIAVINGPGSYTGLRLGLATAKGLCYASGIPLITISTLEWIAADASDVPGDLIIPMVDARRDEVFTAVYDRYLRVKYSPYAMILHPSAFLELLDSHKIIFTGNGAGKAQHFIRHPNAYFHETEPGSTSAALVSTLHFQKRAFADLAYCEPFYVKEFQTSVKPGA